MGWQSDIISEDHVTNFLAMAFSRPAWLRVYYNPPSGSWKAVSLYKDGFEYRQVGPKRGVGKIKRPDLAIQDAAGTKAVGLVLMEAKTHRDDWSDDLPSMMRAYFEGTNEEDSSGLRGLPFFQKRPLTGGAWERLDEKSQDANWFASCDVAYLSCFAYQVGMIKTEQGLQREFSWLDDAAHHLGISQPTFFAAVGWLGGTGEPRVALSFTEKFPDTYRERVSICLAPYLTNAPRRSQSRLS